MQIGLVIIIICIGVLLYSMTNIKEYYSSGRETPPIRPDISNYPYKDIQSEKDDIGWYSLRGQSEFSDFCRTIDGKFVCDYIENGEVKRFISLLKPENAPFQKIDFSGNNINSKFIRDKGYEPFKRIDVRNQGLPLDVAVHKTEYNSTYLRYFVPKNNGTDWESYTMYDSPYSYFMENDKAIITESYINDVKYTPSDVVREVKVSKHFDENDYIDLIKKQTDSKSYIYIDNESKFIFLRNYSRYVDPNSTIITVPGVPKMIYGEYYPNGKF